MGLGIVRFDADRLAICGDRLVELALTIEHLAEIGKVTRVLSVPLYGLTGQFDGQVMPPT
jgi:hypothetical protein